MQLRFIIAALFVASGPLYGSGVYSTSCLIGAVGSPPATLSDTTQSSPAACSISYVPPQQFDYINISGLADDFSTLPTLGSIEALADVHSEVGVTNPPTTFQIISRTYETFETAGPIRAGIINFALLAGANSAGSSEAGISDGVHTYTCLSCSLIPTTAPFELGKPFSALAYADEMGVSPLGDIFGRARVFFSLFEADGVTPVDILDAPVSTPGVPIPIGTTPEPGTFAMFSVIAGFGVMECLRRRVLGLRTWDGESKISQKKAVNSPGAVILRRQPELDRCPTAPDLSLQMFRIDDFVQ
jgi:hypothetical protein